VLKLKILIIMALLMVSGAGIAEAIAPGWSAPLQITAQEMGGINPSLLQDDNGTLWLAWRSNVEGPDGDIWISNSTNGINWSTPVMITENSSDDTHPSLLQDLNGTYWLVFENSTAFAETEIWIQNSSDGITWNAPIPILTTHAFRDYWPSLMQDSNGSFWIAFESKDRGTNNDIYLINSTNGVDWSTPFNLTNASYWDYRPEIMQDLNGAYWAAWTCGYDNSSDNLCIANSTDGSSWSVPREIFIGGEYRPSMHHYQGNYWLFWGRASPDENLYFSNSTDGIDWAERIKITTGTSGDRNPSAVIDSNGTIWIAWQSQPSGTTDWNLWITRSTVTLTVPLGSETWNGMQNISWVSVSGDYQNDTFNLYYSTNGTNWALINSSISADGAYTNKSCEWNTSNVSDGANYTIKIIRVHPLHNESDVSGVFTIDNTPPVIAIVSPAGTTYNTSSVDLNYSVNEPTSWEAYSLDGQANQSGENRTLYGLSNGTHHVTVWANDTVGNLNSSTVHFSVDINGANISVGENYTEGGNITYGVNVNVTAGDNVTVGSNITYADDSNVTFDDNAAIGDNAMIEGVVSIPPGTIISSFARLTNDSRVQAQAGKKVNITYTEGVTIEFVEIPEVAHKIVDLIKDFNLSTVSTGVPGLIEVVDDDATPDFGITIAANGSMTATIEVAECEVNPEKGSNELGNLRSNYLYINATEIANKTNITIGMKYPSGLLESSVRLYKFNSSSNTWVEQSGWRSDGYVYANVSGFSVYGVAGTLYEGGGSTTTSGGGGLVTPITAKVTSLSSEIFKKIASYFGLARRQTYDLSGVKGGDALSLAASLISLGEYPDLRGVDVVPILEVKELSGDIYRASSERVLRRYSHANKVIVARGDLAPDSMTALALARVENVPIVLTEPGMLPEETLEAVKRLKPKEIIIVGGTVAVSEGVEGELSKIAKVDRKWGATRYETAVEVAKGIKRPGMIVITTGSETSLDAFITSAGHKAPLIYVTEKGIPEEAREYLSERRAAKIVYSSGVSEDVKEEIEGL